MDSHARAAFLWRARSVSDNTCVTQSMSLAPEEMEETPMMASSRRRRFGHLRRRNGNRSISCGRREPIHPTATERVLIGMDLTEPRSSR